MELDVLDAFSFAVIITLFVVAFVLSLYAFDAVNRYNKVLDEYEKNFEEYATGVSITVGDETTDCECSEVNGTMNCVCAVQMPNPSETRFLA